MYVWSIPSSPFIISKSKIIAHPIVHTINTMFNVLLRKCTPYMYMYVYMYMYMYMYVYMYRCTCKWPGAASSSA